MRRLIFVIIALAVAVFAGWYYWNLSQRLSSAPVSALLPRETIFLAHLPDFNRTFDEWYHCDIYQLYREPAVQDFLRPALAGLSNLPKTNAASQTLQEIEQLDPKHAFFALTALDNNNPRFVGGFRFRGSQEEAERVISRWRSTFQEQTPGAKREKLQYQRHEIELVTAPPFALATTTQHIAQPSRTGPPITRHSFICSQRYFPIGLPRCALLFDQAQLPANQRCSRKCAASPVRRGSRTGKYTTCFFSGCQG